ncbi:hypothetical protein HMPREF9120_02354 [Neisseria sp. oral taxon 020 str. F0370]|nr:hypothetical protein [Neisseria sp. KEM232]ASP17109.1 hypothetical protein CGZ77_04715 [Neisseria sp. KEM232]EKY04311.1 hypothetical protein HMPREF9120_02354 [Neisseria sp. oral taxon 020 str. F0370]
MAKTGQPKDTNAPARIPFRHVFRRPPTPQMQAAPRYNAGRLKHVLPALPQPCFQTACPSFLSDTFPE